MLLVSVALVQINGTAWRFHLEIQKHLVTEGTPAQPALQVGQAGALGQNNATVSSLDKESHSLTTNRGHGHPGCVVCKACRKLIKRRGSSSQGSMRSEVMWLNPKDVHPEKIRPAFWCKTFQFPKFSSWILISHHSKLKYPKRRKQ